RHGHSGGFQGRLRAIGARRFLDAHGRGSGVDARRPVAGGPSAAGVLRPAAPRHSLHLSRSGVSMPEDRTFLMGKFPAVLPGGLRYARNHMWCRLEGARGRFGFTSYAIRLMQDVYFLDWQVNAGDRVELLQQIGHIETSKAVSDLFAPLAGTILAFNPELLKDP